MKRYVIGLILLTSAAFATGQSTNELPLVYLAPQSTGTAVGETRDESEKITRDFAKNCPNVQLAVVQSDADYVVDRSHVNVGLPAWNQQLAVTDAWGNALEAVKENGIGTSEEKNTCALILADWSDQALTRKKYVNAINAGFRKSGTAGSAEIVGNNLIVHSERANRMRFYLLLANNKTPSLQRRAGIVTFVYTNDADENFAYDVKSGQVDENYGAKSSGKATDAASESGANVEHTHVP
jgi:hypothetical protein